VDRPNPSWSGPYAGGGPEDRALSRIFAELRRHLGDAPPGELWLGDDAAVVPGPAGALVLATDAAVEGVHGDLRLMGLDDFGWKALTAAVSDLAAMGARPMCSLVTYCSPPGLDFGLLTSGIAQAAATYRCPVVGGDVTAADQLVVSVSVVGRLDGGGPVPRAGACPGDVVFVTGACGGSAAGLRLLRSEAGRTGPGAGPPGTGGPEGGAEEAGALPDEIAAALSRAHRRPTARIAEGEAARRSGATAMMDVSDGLALDLHRLALASGVGLRLVVVPTRPGATEDEALHGGEDFELIVATPDPDALLSAFGAEGLDLPVEIGRCTADPAERDLRGHPLSIDGWQHPV
jgi:thiamine-monophosphate kinase